MRVSTVSSRELRQSVGAAMDLAKFGPVIITNHGKRSHVLMTYLDYMLLSGHRRSLVDALAMPGLSEIDFAVTREEEVPREID